MSTFDPDAHKPQPRGDNEPLPAGTFVLAITSFERRQSKKDDGGDYLRCRYEVCAGPLKGRSFFSNVSLDTRKAGSADRLHYFCKSAGIKGPIDLSDDDALDEKFVAKPFKAIVSRERRGEFTNNDIKRYADSWTDAERDEADGWVQDWKDGAEVRGSRRASSSPRDAGRSEFSDVPDDAYENEDYADDDKIPF